MMLKIKLAHIGNSLDVLVEFVCSIFIIFNDILGTFSTCFIFSSTNQNVFKLTSTQRTKICSNL